MGRFFIFEVFQIVFLPAQQLNLKPALKFLASLIAISI